MAIRDVICENCGYKEEIIDTIEKISDCPKCKGKMKIQFNFTGQSFKIHGYCYNNEYNKK